MEHKLQSRRHTAQELLSSPSTPLNQFHDEYILASHDPAIHLKHQEIPDSMRGGIYPGTGCLVRQR